ncbi:MAG: hypothetical protein KME32_30990 [Mojavia pulchra JT2-VF2]|uniref:Uncharacterized protein n=1 Tax=Mojavia pulchra JT2-VF2 TaxID=287848 RepID=A0A951Q468_9NOST|nr:hypothetical protein [Mojavia pulchra JT2-VF2]
MNIHLLAQRSPKISRVFSTRTLFYVLPNLVTLVALLGGARLLIISRLVQHKLKPQVC